MSIVSYVRIFGTFQLSYPNGRPAIGDGSRDIPIPLSYPIIFISILSHFTNLKMGIIKLSFHIDSRRHLHLKKHLKRNMKDRFNIV